MWLIDANALLEEIDEEIDLYDDDSNKKETLIRLGLKIARKDIVKQQGIEVTKQYDAECSECVVPTKEIYKLRDKLQKLSNDKWESFKCSGCSDRYLQGRAHAYSIVVDMIDDLLEDNLGDDTDA